MLYICHWGKKTYSHRFVLIGPSHVENEQPKRKKKLVWNGFWYSFLMNSFVRNSRLFSLHYQNNIHDRKKWTSIAMDIQMMAILFETFFFGHKPCKSNKQNNLGYFCSVVFWCLTLRSRFPIIEFWLIWRLIRAISMLCHW